MDNDVSCTFQLPSPLFSPVINKCTFQHNNLLLHHLLLSFLLCSTDSYFQLKFYACHTKKMFQCLCDFVRPPVLLLLFICNKTHIIMKYTCKNYKIGRKTRQHLNCTNSCPWYYISASNSLALSMLMFGHTNYRELPTTTDNKQQLPTIYQQLTTNAIYRQQTIHYEAPTKYQQVLFTAKY